MSQPYVTVDEYRGHLVVCQILFNDQDEAYWNPREGVSVTSYSLASGLASALGMDTRGSTLSEVKSFLLEHLGEIIEDVWGLYA